MASVNKEEPINPDNIDLSNIEFEPITTDTPAPTDTTTTPKEKLELITVKREDTRGRLALAFLIGFFVLLVIGMIISAFNTGDKITSAKEILLTLSGILSGPLGFVIGYYFRSSEE
ncbi:MAG: hypothetical protein WCJ58_07520 [bacterium]